MEDSGIKAIVEELSRLRGSFENYKGLKDDQEELARRLAVLEEKLNRYESFMDKTSGFFTRLGFYGDAAVIWLRSKFKRG